MRKGRPPSRPITNPLATTPLSLVTRRRCSSPGPSQGTHISSRSTLDLRTLDSIACVYSVGEADKNRRTSCSSCSECYLRVCSSWEIPGRPMAVRIRPEIDSLTRRFAMLILGELALHRLGEFTATGLAQAGTLRTNAFLGIVENPL